MAAEVDKYLAANGVYETRGRSFALLMVRCLLQRETLCCSCLCSCSPARCSGLQDKLSTLSDGYNRRGRPVRVATTRRTRSLEETGAALAMQRARTRRKYAAAAESAQWP